MLISFEIISFSHVEFCMFFAAHETPKTIFSYF